MAALQPFVENTTPLIVFSSVMVGLIALTLPLVYLYERAKKNKLDVDDTTIAPSKSTTSYERDDEDGGINSSLEDTENSNYKLVPVQLADECLKCDPCEPPMKLKADQDSGVNPIVLTVMGSETGLATSGSEPAFEVNKNNIPVEATEYHTIKRKMETYVPKIRKPSPPPADEGIQTSVYEFDISRDPITIPDTIVLEGKLELEQQMGRTFVAETFTTEEKLLISAINEENSKKGRPVRYERSVSNNRIITARNCPCQPSNSCTQCRRKCGESKSRHEGSFDDESKSRFS